MYTTREDVQAAVDADQYNTTKRTIPFAELKRDALTVEQAEEIESLAMHHDMQEEEEEKNIDDFRITREEYESH